MFKVVQTFYIMSRSCPIELDTYFSLVVLSAGLDFRFRPSGPAVMDITQKGLSVVWAELIV